MGDLSLQLNLSCLFFAFPLGAAQQGCEAGSAQAGIPKDQDCVPGRLEAGGEPGLPGREGRGITLQTAEGLALISKSKA